jgi:large subunit ribosomal protein L32
MPQEPKKRHSRARQGKRRASIKLSIAQMTTCTNCGNTLPFHIVCAKCGYYKGEKILHIKETETKK